MSSIIIYASRNGNTKLIADALARKLQCPIYNLNEADFNEMNLTKVDTIFLGSGIYGGTLHRRILDFGKFLNSNDPGRTETIRIFFFITWLGRGKSDLGGINHFKKILKQRNYNISDNYFRCFGESFGFIRKHHPDTGDLDRAVEWAEPLYTGS